MTETVLIYRNELLHFSETFIKAQAEGLQAFHPRLAALRRVIKGLPLADDSILLTETRSVFDKLRFRLYNATGVAPVFHRRLQLARPRLLHAHFAVDGARALPIAERLGIPLVITLHGYDVTTKDSGLRALPGGAFYLKHRQRLWDGAAVFLCISEFLRERALAAGFPAEKLRVHYIGVDLDRFSPGRGERRKNLVLYVGRIVEVKGLAYLLRAMALIGPRAELVVLGDGPLRAEMEALAAELGVRCEFLGAQPIDKVRQWLARARVLCLPSVTTASGATEGLGIAACEAQAMGVPVVGTWGGGIPEVVVDGETGLLAAERDSAALAGHIVRLLDDDVFWRKCSEGGAAHVRQKFNLAAQTRELEKIYGQVIADRKG